MKAEIKIPEGYERVTEGTIANDYRWFSTHDMEWHLIDEYAIGHLVGQYSPIIFIRPIKVLNWFVDNVETRHRTYCMNDMGAMLMFNENGQYECDICHIVGKPTLAVINEFMEVWDAGIQALKEKT